MRFDRYPHGVRASLLYTWGLPEADFRDRRFPRSIGSEGRSGYSGFDSRRFYWELVGANMQIACAVPSAA